MPQPALKSSADGAEVGRLFIRDLVLAYQSPEGGPPPMGGEDKARLVDGLTDPDEIAVFNEYRYVYEYLAKAAITCSLHRQTAQTAFWKMAFILMGFLYTDARDKLAVQRPLFPEAGDFREEILTGERKRQGESQLPELLFLYEESLGEAGIIVTAVELLGELVRVPETRVIVGASASLLGQLKSLFEDVWAKLPARREALGPFAERLRALTEADLRPRPAAVKRARQKISFQVVQGRIDDLYSLLRRGKRP